MIQKNSFEKGQLFSLDFVIAISITVLAIGLLLNFYELNIYEAKEARINTETQIIATTAANLLLESNRCNPEGSFQDQGYKLFGCTNDTQFTLLSKEEMMIPDNFSCYMEIDDEVDLAGCNDDPDDASSVISIERTFLTSLGEEEEERDPIDLVFVMDKSGSMDFKSRYVAVGFNDDRSVYVENDIAYLAADDEGLHAIDVLDPDNIDNPALAVFSETVLDVHSNTSLSSVLIITPTELIAVNKDPSSFADTGRFSIGDTVDIFTNGNLAYLLEAGVLQVYDAVTMSGISIGSLALTGPQKIIVEENSLGDTYAYILDNGNLRIVDVTDPSVLLPPSYTSPFTINDFDVLNEIVYFVDNDVIGMIDTTGNKTNPSVSDSEPLLAGTDGRFIKVHATLPLAFVRTDEEFITYDLSPCTLSTWVKTGMPITDWFVYGDLGYFTSDDWISVLDFNMVEGSPYFQAQNAVIDFVNRASFEFSPPIGNPDRVGYVSFFRTSNLDYPLINDLTGFETTVKGIITGDNTNIEAGIETANTELLSSNPESLKVQILLSDGYPDRFPPGDPVADVSVPNGIIIHTVAFRLATGGLGATYLEDIAIATGGTFNSADDEDSLSAILDLIELSIIGAGGEPGELDKGGFERCVETGVCDDKIIEKHLILKIWK